MKTSRFLVHFPWWAIIVIVVSKILIIAGMILIVIICKQNCESCIAVSTAIYAFFTGGLVLLAMITAIFTWNTWVQERILELKDEYDDLAGSRKEFWNNVDNAYKAYIYSKSSSSVKDIRAADYLIRGLLFRINSRFQECLLINVLDNTPVSPCLQHEFANNGFPLTQKAKISTEKRGSKWLITDYKDGKKAYRVRKEGNILSVYQKNIPVYPPCFEPRNMEDDEENDLLEWIRQFEERLECFKSSEDNLRELWRFATFVYPNPRRDAINYVPYHNRLFSESDLIKLDKARGKLSRFWNKWASSSYSKRELLAHYKAAYEQLIMLTWFEIALVRKIEDHGRGKIKLFELTKEVHQLIKHQKTASILCRLRMFTNWICTGRKPSGHSTCLHDLLECICKGDTSKYP